MDIITWIGERVDQPGDSETFRAQKTLGVALGAFGSLFTLLTAAMIYLVGFGEAAAVLMVMAVVLAVCVFSGLSYPRRFRLILQIGLFTTIAANVLAQILTGGFTAGTMIIVWAVVGLMGAVLLTSPRFAAAMTIFFGLSIVIIALLNPRIEHLGLRAPIEARLAIGAYCLVFMGCFIAISTLFLFRVIETYRSMADELLLNILPASIAARLKKNPESIADVFGEVTVLFADIVDFTTLSSDADAAEVVGFLNEIFSEFDDLVKKHDLVKIKTIGDAYMAAAGLPEPREDHTQAVAALAIDMLDTISRHEGFHGNPVKLRIGINTGPVVAGVIGHSRFIYDLWGDVVNVASRMESNGLANEIQVTRGVKERLEGQYAFLEREPIAVKGKGLMVTYLLQRP